MAHRSPLVGCYGTSLLSYMAQTLCILYGANTLHFVITLYEFDVNLCGLSIALSDFIVTLCELAITFVHLSILYVSLLFTDAGLIYYVI